MHSKILTGTLLPPQYRMKSFLKCVVPENIQNKPASTEDNWKFEWGKWVFRKAGISKGMEDFRNLHFERVKEEKEIESNARQIYSMK